jgi:hypothetical protein
VVVGCWDYGAEVMRWCFGGEVLSCCCFGSGAASVWLMSCVFGSS